MSSARTAHAITRTGLLLGGLALFSACGPAGELEPGDGAQIATLGSALLTSARVRIATPNAPAVGKYTPQCLNFDIYGASFRDCSGSADQVWTLDSNGTLINSRPDFAGLGGRPVCVCGTSGGFTSLQIVDTGACQNDACRWTATPDGYLKIKQPFGSRPGCMQVGSKFNFVYQEVLANACINKMGVSYVESFPQAGLEAYWRLDESAGSVVADQSGRGHQATADYGSNLWEKTPAPTRFANAGSYHFQDVAGARITAPLVTTQVDNVALTLWARRDGDPTHNTALFYNGHTGTGGYGLFLLPGSNRVALLLGGLALYDLGYSPPVGQWVHYALTRTAGTWRLYVNGVQQAATTNTAPRDPSLGPYTGTFIGSNGWGENFAGQIDDVRVYTRALSPTEIESLALGNPQ